MNIRGQDKFFLLLLSCLFSIRISSTQEGSSFFFYQQPEYPRDCKEVRDQCSSDSRSGVYTIKPDGYLQPFEVYCNNDLSSGGWTVLHRRLDGSVTFQREWQEYKNGFGFLSSEFWIGNDKLSYLTNQAVYELRIDIMMSNGSSFYVKYNSFRISDEWSQYALVTADEFSGNSSCVVSTCPNDSTHGGCTCQTICRDSMKMIDCNDDCIETCIPVECTNGDSYINDDCTQNCTCINNQLNCDTSYQCSQHATCTVQSGVRKCYCNDGYEGDGETCERVISSNFEDCYEAYQAGHTTDGVYTLLPPGWPGSPFEVFCNMTFGSGGWTVFQRRIDGMTDFYRNWTEYKHGFGTLNQGNDFWLGNEQLHYLTNQKDYMLRIDFVDTGHTLRYDEYTEFKTGDESTKYQLSYGSRGNYNTGSSNLYYNNGGQFSTHDQDNDGCSFHDCAERHRGGWWYSTAVNTTWCQECSLDFTDCLSFETRSSCSNLCTLTNLNGDYNGGNGENVFYATHGLDCNHIFAEMKIRPSSP